MSTLIDLVGGIIVGGMILLLTLAATERVTREFFNFNADAIVQNNLTRIAYITEYDLRKMGFGVPEANRPTIIKIGQYNHLKFLAHLNLGADAIADTIDYNIIAAETYNFGDTIITMYKIIRTIKVSGEATNSMMIGKVGDNKVFRYLDRLGRLRPPSSTEMVEVTLVALNPHVILSPELVTSQLNDFDSPEARKKELIRLLRPSFWRQTRLVSKNLLR